MRERERLAAITMVIALIAAAAAFAVDPSGAVATNSADLGAFPERTADTTTTNASHVRQANVEANMSTLRWSGLVGNVTGTIMLGDSNDNVLYSWTGSGLLVYASRVNPIWGDLADAAEADIEANFSFIDAGNGDNYTNTFTGGSTNIGSGIFPTLASDYANTFDNTQTGAWRTYSLTDGNDAVFAAGVREDQTAFHGGTADYQMILPENGTLENTAATTWNLYVELV